MLQAALADRVLFDLFPFTQDGFVAAKVDVGRCDVVLALVVTPVVVICDEGADLTLKIARKIIVFQEDAVFHCLMPAFDLALGLRVEGRAADVLHFLPRHGDSIGQRLARDLDAMIDLPASPF